MAVLCTVDGKPVADQSYLCTGCTRRLERALRSVAELEEELLLTVTRQTSRVDGVGDPLPFHLDASMVYGSVRNTLTTWARGISEARGMPVWIGARIGPVCSRSPACAHPSCGQILGELAGQPTLGEIAAWILNPIDRHVEWIRHQRAASEVADEIGYAVRIMRQAIDRPGERWYAGPCGDDSVAQRVVAAVFGTPSPCREELYALPYAETVTCRECGAEYDLAERREWLLNSTADHFAHASLIAQALPALGIPGEPAKLAARIRTAGSRGRLIVRWRDPLGRPQYRIGDVVDLIRDDAARDFRRPRKIGA